MLGKRRKYDIPPAVQRQLAKRLPVSELKGFLSALIDITAYPDRAVWARGVERTITTPHKLLRGARVLSRLEMSLHAGTHLDLPWTLDFGTHTALGVTHEVPNQDTQAYVKMMEEYYRPRLIPCTILDVSFKRSFVETFLEEHRVEDSKSSTLTLRSDIPIESYRELFDQLTITRRILEQLLDPVGGLNGLKGHMLILCTDWWYWQPTMADLSAPLFQCWHPFLLNPYIDPITLRHLIEQVNILGLGTDTFGAENPLHYVYNTQECLPVIRELKHSLDATSPDLHGNTSCPPVHLLLLSKRKLLLENLSIPPSLMNVSLGKGAFDNVPIEGERKAVLNGHILIVPYPIGAATSRQTPRDALPVRVFFSPEDRHDTR